MCNAKWGYCRHNGQRDYKCGVCDFYGYTFTDIRKHIERKHADIKTLVCDKCAMPFKTDIQLRVRVFSGLYPSPRDYVLLPSLCSVLVSLMILVYTHCSPVMWIHSTVALLTPPVLYNVQEIKQYCSKRVKMCLRTS